MSVLTLFSSAEEPGEGVLTSTYAAIFKQPTSR